MAYCATADLKDALGEAKLIQLTDDESQLAIHDGRVTKAIAAADTLIDSYLRGKHTVPLSPVPDRIRQMSVDLTIWHLYKRRRDQDMPEDLQKDYDRQVRFLEGLRDGKNLLDTPAAPANTGAIFKTNKTSDSRVFTEETLKVY